MTDDHRRRDKLADPRLAELIDAGSSRTEQTIVELALPRPQVRFAAVDRTNPRGPQLADVQEPTSADDMAQAVEAARAVLHGITGADPGWIQAAKAFVVEVDGRQLEQIVDSPLFRRIALNRRLKRQTG